MVWAEPGGLVHPTGREVGSVDVEHAPVHAALGQQAQPSSGQRGPKATAGTVRCDSEKDQLTVPVTLTVRTGVSHPDIPGQAVGILCQDQMIRSHERPGKAFVDALGCDLLVRERAVVQADERLTIVRAEPAQAGSRRNGRQDRGDGWTTQVEQATVNHEAEPMGKTIVGRARQVEPDVRDPVWRDVVQRGPEQRGSDPLMTPVGTHGQLDLPAGTDCMPDRQTNKHTSRTGRLADPTGRRHGPCVSGSREQRVGLSWRRQKFQDVSTDATVPVGRDDVDEETSNTVTAGPVEANDTVKPDPSRRLGRNRVMDGHAPSMSEHASGHNDPNDGGAPVWVRYCACPGPDLATRRAGVLAGKRVDSETSVLRAGWQLTTPLPLVGE